METGNVQENLFELLSSIKSKDGKTNIYEHLTILVSDKQIQTHECSHKLAAELIAGLIRGSKYWHLDELKSMWSKLKVIFDLIIENISTENIKLWLMCFSTAFVS